MASSSNSRGTTYYTGFAWKTPQLFGADLENHYPAPDTPVTLAQATFVASEAGSESPWKWLGSELHIGEFGGRERGNVVDSERKPRTHTTRDGRLVLAVPTWSLQSGERILSYDVLAFNPRETSDVDDTHWTYVGNLPAGYDNSDNCGEDAAGNPPCVKNSSNLAFVEQSGLPALRVTVSGGSAARGVTPPRNTDTIPGENRICRPLDTGPKELVRAAYRGGNWCRRTQPHGD